MSFCVLIPACHFCWSYICTPTSLTYFLWLVLLQKLCNSLFFHTLSQVEFFLQFRMPLIIIFSLHAVWAFGYILPKVPQSLSGILEVFVYWSIPYFLYKKVCLLLFCRKNLSIIICIYFHQIALPSLIIHFFFISPFTEDAREKSEMCSSVSIPQYLSANHPTPLRNHFQKINILPVRFFENGLHPVMICQAQTISRQHQRLRCFLI